MNTIGKLLLAAMLAIAILVIGSGALLAASVVRSGLVTVKVHETGPHGTKRIHIPIPAGLIYLGMDVMPWVMDDDEIAEVRAELKEAGPALAAAMLELEDIPDAVLVDVQNAHESVRIVKQGRSFEIHVDGPDGQVEISLPAGLLGRVAREIA